MLKLRTVVGGLSLCRSVGVLSALFAVRALAIEYTWTGSANRLWDDSSANWTTSGVAAAWSDGNSAYFTSAG